MLTPHCVGDLKVSISLLICSFVCIVDQVKGLRAWWMQWRQEGFASEEIILGVDSIFRKFSKGVTSVSVNDFFLLTNNL